MNIWLITIGEPIPHETNKLRLHRTGIISKFISENSNHNIIWWTSTFNHFTKEHIYLQTTYLNINHQLKIIALKGKGYKKNISINRIIDHRQIAKEFKIKAKLEMKPDIIVSAFPTLNLCVAAIKYAKENHIPVLIDYRDMWPEVFTDVLPNIFKPLGKIFLFYLFHRTNKMFKDADGIIGITESFLYIALQKVKREKNDYDAIFPLAYLTNQFSIQEYESAKHFWANLKILKDQDCFRICFFGTIGYQFDFETIIEVAKSWSNQNRLIQFVMCGTGDRLNELKKATTSLNNIIFPGYVNAAQIKVLMELSDCGLCPYYPKEAFLNSIPGKAIEYLSGGLPLLCSLENGILGNLVKENNLGFNYFSGNSNSLVQALNNFINMAKEQNISQNNIHKFFQENYDANTVYQHYMNHLELVKENFMKKYK